MYEGIKYVNDVFGEVIDTGIGWETVEKLSFSLFDKIYSVNVVAAYCSVKNMFSLNKNFNKGITCYQESVLTRFKALIVSKRSEIEGTIVNHFNETRCVDDCDCGGNGYTLCDISFLFVPYAIQISRRGDCAICFSDNGNVCELADAELEDAVCTHDELDDAEFYNLVFHVPHRFVITILPKLNIYSSGIFFYYLDGGGENLINIQEGLNLLQLCQLCNNDESSY